MWLTERLSLRRPSLDDVDDVDDVLRLLQEPLVTVHNSSDALTDRDQAEVLVERWRHHWDDHGIGYCVVTWRGDTAMVGVCGVKVMTLGGRQVFNLLYRLTPTVWGRGVASEAATELVLRATAHELRLPVVARVRPQNRASAAVALGAGLRRAAQWDSSGEDGPERCTSSSHGDARNRFHQTTASPPPAYRAVCRVAQTPTSVAAAPVSQPGHRVPLTETSPVWPSVYSHARPP